MILIFYLIYLIFKHKPCLHIFLQFAILQILEHICSLLNDQNLHNIYHNNRILFK